MPPLSLSDGDLRGLMNAWAVFGGEQAGASRGLSYERPNPSDQVCGLSHTSMHMCLGREGHTPCRRIIEVPRQARSVLGGCG